MQISCRFGKQKLRKLITILILKNRVIYKNAVLQQFKSTVKQHYFLMTKAVFYLYTL